MRLRKARLQVEDAAGIVFGFLHDLGNIVGGLGRTVQGGVQALEGGENAFVHLGEELAGAFAAAILFGWLFAEPSAPEKPSKRKSSK